MSIGKNKNLYFISALPDEKLRIIFDEVKTSAAPNLNIDMHIGQSHRVMEAADYILLASGTATLEAMLYKKPMVVAYRLSWLTYVIVKMLAKIPYASLPNILAGKQIVPECLQGECTAEIISDELDKYLASEEEVTELRKTFSDMTNKLKKGASEQAANAVLKLIETVPDV